MSVTRQLNVLGQARIDVPHLRSIDSSVAADFDLLAGRIMAGSRALVVQGFDIIGAPGNAATSLSVSVANSVLMHAAASEAGTIFSVPASRPAETLNATNAKVIGGFTAGTVNYIGLDLRRSADDSTADLVQFLDPDTATEKPKTVPLGRTLDYIFVVSTQDFSGSPTILPLAKVTTDGASNVVTIEDARNLAYRLGTGGILPDAKAAYAWPGGRTEPLLVPNSTFSSGDKSIKSLKEWQDAAMTRLWEIGGGEYWYSATADRNVQMQTVAVPFSNGDYFEWTGVYLHWKGIKFVFDNSTGYYNDVEDDLNNNALNTLVDGDCIYVDLDRTQNRVATVNGLVAQRAPLLTLGTPAVPGSRFVIAWRTGSSVFSRNSRFPVGTITPAATASSLGTVRVSHNTAGTYYTPPNPVSSDASPVAISEGGRNRAFGFIGLDVNKAGTVSPLSVATNGLTVITAAASATVGLFADSSAGTGTAISGSANTGVGVSGFAGGIGVLGQSVNSFGVRGICYASGGSDAGVHGQFPATSGFATGTGVYGESLGGGSGGRFTSVKGYGLVSTGGDGSGGAPSGGYGVHGIGGVVSGSGGRFTGTGTGVGAFLECGATSRTAASVSGTLDLFEESAVPAAPASTRARLYLTNNGLGSPNKKQRLSIRWGNGQVTTIAESDAY